MTDALFDGDLADELTELLGDSFLQAVLTRMIVGGGPAYNPGQGTPDPYACLGIVDDYTVEQLGSVFSTDRKCLILASSIQIEPEPGDYFMPLPLTRLIHENFALLMMYAYSQPVLARLVDDKFRGEWKYLDKALFQYLVEQISRACLELGSLLASWTMRSKSEIF